MQRHSSSHRSVGYLLLSMEHSVGHHHARREFPDSLSRQYGEYALTETRKIFSSPRSPIAAHWQPLNERALVAGSFAVNIGGPLPAGGPCLPAEAPRAVSIPWQPLPSGG